VRPASLFDTVAIVGVGLIGGSLGLGLRERFLAERVIGLDHDPATLDAARGLGVIDEAQLTAGPWLAEADLVVLATPVQTLVPLGRSILPYLRPDTIVTDVGSVKREVVEGLRGARFVGGHPMTGSERIGVLHADAALIENAVWVLTPDGQSDPEAVDRVQDLVEHLGGRPLRVGPVEHDRLVAAVSHLPYLAAVALTTMIAEDEDSDQMMLLAAGGFRDLTRVASGSPVMSGDMVVGNLRAVREALTGFRAQLTVLEQLLEEPDALLRRAEHAKRSRDSFPIVRRSLLPPRHEVVIAVPDRPGQLSRITHALGEAGVNIKDIEVLGIREAGGAVRLAFDHAEGMKLGTEALRAVGYEARVRGEG
jgi:prephenate dehydrogenase